MRVGFVGLRIMGSLQLAAVSAYEQVVSLPISNAAKEVYMLAARHGLRTGDFAAVYACLNQKRTRKKKFR